MSSWDNTDSSRIIDRLLDRTHPNYGSSWMNVTKVSTITIVFGYVSYTIYQLIQQYGINGTIQYIWEGDPYSTDNRNRFDQLDKVRITKRGIVKIITKLEIALERARLDTIDNATPSYIVKQWKKNLPDIDLRQRLSFLSYDLDQLAAKVDQIIITTNNNKKNNNNNNVDIMIRQQKKQLSDEIVQLMNRTDQLINYFKSVE